jgi:hypothetical protein
LANGLVLNTRLDVTQRNLRRINELAKTIARREAGVNDLLSMPNQFRVQAQALIGTVNTLKERALEIGDEALYDEIGSVESTLKGLWTDAGKQAKEADRLRAQLFEPLGDRQDVQDFLVGAAEEMRSTLTTENYWKQRARCEALFSEYVDLLHGIALRSARYGDEELSIGELFLVADELPRVWGRIEGWTWQSLAVPSWLDQNRSTEAMVLRIGFPEWTIWALPLLQHEFAHIFVKRKQLSTAETDAVALADALAVLVAGPAYVSATLLLRLDPGAVSAEQPEVGLRAATIVRTLSTIAENAELAPVVKLAKRLEEEWRAAVVDAGGSSEAQEEAFGSAAWQVALEVARSKLLGFSTNGGGNPQPLWATKWATISAWADSLVADRVEDIDLASEDGDDRERRPSLTLILNAAWLARIRPDPAHDAARRDVEAIGERAVKRMLDHLRAPERAADPRGGNVRP